MPLDFSCVVDIAPFAERRSWLPEDVGLQWNEMRSIHAIRVAWADAPPDDVRVEYWRNHWPHERAPEGIQAGQAGWHHEGDWLNGGWQTANTWLEKDDEAWTWWFEPVNTEFDDLGDYAVKYRSTLKVRLVSDSPVPAGDMQVFTDSEWETVETLVQWKSAPPDLSGIVVEVYNGYIVGRQAVDQGLILSLCVMRSKETTEADHSIITVRGKKPFSFTVDDLDDGPLFIREYGVMISDTDGPTLADYEASLVDAPKTRYDMVLDEEEQTLSRAWADMPLKTSFYMPLGIEGRRQRFGVNPDGSIFRRHERNPWTTKGSTDPTTLRCDGDTAEQKIDPGFPVQPFNERHPLRGYLPVMVTAWETGAVRYEQTAFASLLSGDVETLDINAGGTGDDLVVGVSIIELTNTGAVDTRATLSFNHTTRGERVELSLDGDCLRAGDNLRGLVDTHGRGELNQHGDRVDYYVDLAVGATHTVCLKVPYFPYTDDETDQLRALNEQMACANIADFWEERISRGMRIVTPEPLINDFHRTHVAHLFINHERHHQAEVDIARVGSFSYGAYANESIMQISDMDRRGYHDQAAKGYETWLEYQSTVLLAGDFSSPEGCFYGAGGQESGNYNQHHGWVLWGLADHFAISGDREWLQRVASKLVKGCDWVINERARTKQTETLPDGTERNLISWGFLPAGALEDIQDYWFWLSTNCYTWWGLNRAAKALGEIDHPDAERIQADADAMHADLIAGFTESMVRTPVVRLRDGTAIPHTPAHLHLRGRAFGWIRETLEGAIHLLNCRVIDPTGAQGTQIVKDYEDNLYISRDYGYSERSIPDEERYWFTRGGFSQQPNLLCGPEVYFLRDDIKHFLRGYFNGFASAFHADTRMLTEHPLPELGDVRGDHYKSSDEAQSTYWLRLMFIHESGDDLHLGFGIPRYWLRDGETVSIERAVTVFGEMSMDITSNVDSGTITAHIDPPIRKSPSSITLRLRHPGEKKLTGVTVNGQEWTRFEGEEVVLDVVGEEVVVVGRY